MGFFLQIDAHRSVGPDDLVRADACVGGDVSTRVWNSDVGGNVADRVMRALDGSNHQPTQKFLTGFRRAGRLRNSGGRKQRTDDNWRQTTIGLSGKAALTDCSCLEAKENVENVAENASNPRAV